MKKRTTKKNFTSLNIIPFVDIFDTALALDKKRDFKARDYIYASEVGMGYFDRFLSMNGVRPSNDPNEIAVRKFKLGELIEDFFKLVLWEMGILKAQEKSIRSNFGFGCEVSGRMDVVYGGRWDIKDIESVFEELKFLKFIGLLSDTVKKFAEENKNVDYDICGIEIKSVSDFVYNRIDARKSPEIHHACQAFHYAYWEGIPFQLVYFDKNNGRMQSFWILPTDNKWYSVYMNDIKEMSNYYLNNIRPEKEKLLLFDGERFSTNWKVEYSKYLTAEYKFSTKDEYREYATPFVQRFNRVMARVRDGKKLTQDNILAINEMKKFGYEIELNTSLVTEDIPHEEVPNINTLPSTSDKLAKLKALKK